MVEVNAVKDMNDDGLVMAEAGCSVEKAPLETSPHHRPRWHFIAALAFVAAILLAVGLSLGLTLGRSEAINKGDPATSNNNNSNGDGDGSNHTEEETENPVTSNNNTAENNTRNDTVTAVEEYDMYNTTLGPLDAAIPLFSSRVTQGYANRADLEDSLTEVGKFLANNVVNRNLNIPGYQHVALPFFKDDVVDTDGPVAAIPGDQAQETDGTSSYETNNQEKGVDEGDLVKSDGTFVYAAYGGTLVVLNVTSGDIVTEIQMPSTETISVARPEEKIPDTHYLNANIESLLVTSSRLVVVMSGYGHILQEELNMLPILTEYASTHVRVYDTSLLTVAAPLEPELKFLGSKDLNGYFREARSVGDNIHIVSVSGIETFSSLIQPLERYQSMFTGLTDDEYVAAASIHAEEVVIPAFVERLIGDISEDGVLPRLARITMWQTTSSGTDAESMIFGNGIIDTMVQVTSFDVMSSNDSSDELDVSISGVFLPSFWVNVYATEQLLVIAGKGWNFSPMQDANTETTYLVGFSLLEDETEPAAVGSVAGYLLNQFSLDHVIEGEKNYLRVATTIQNMWIPQPLIVEGGDTISIRQQVPTTENQVLILEVPVIGGNETGVMTEVSSIENLGKEGEVFTAIRFLDDIGFAVTYERTDPFYVLNLDVYDPSVLGQIDNITGFSRYMHPINDDNSLIVAVGRESTPEGMDLGFQITLFNVTDPVMPKELHRLVIEREPQGTSYSEAELDHKAFRYISVGNETVQEGLLIIPVNVGYWQDSDGYFDGFSVFSIDPQAGISQVFNVSHSDWNSKDECAYWPRFPGRSMVFNGDMMTFKGHTVNSTDLGTGEHLWGLKMECQIY